MHIVGGIYLELIKEPYWREIYGSGMRAAASISLMSESVTLHSYLSEQEVIAARAKSDVFGFPLIVNPRVGPISFSYFHSLSCPEITPHQEMIHHEQSIIVEKKECILRFGFLEGDAVVKGRSVVFDPQSAFNPEIFAANGSSAERLAIVLNSGEARVLSRETSIEKAGQILKKNNHADVVVIKQGPIGCTVFTDDKVSTIPAFKTSRTNPIGSGDVFAAVFAHYWGKKTMILWRQRRKHPKVPPLLAPTNKCPCRMISKHKLSLFL